MASFATLLSDNQQYATWRDAMITVFQTRQPGVVRATLVSFVDAFRAACRGCREQPCHSAALSSSSSLSSNLIVLRLHTSAQQVEWATFFQRYLELWHDYVDLPSISTFFNRSKASSIEQLTYRYIIRSLLSTREKQSIVWFDDDAPWSFVRNVIMSAVPYPYHVWYVWGTSKLISSKMSIEQVASILAPTCVDAFIGARPLIVTCVDQDADIVAASKAEQTTPPAGYHTSSSSPPLPRDMLCCILQWTDYATSLVMGRVCRSWLRMLKTEYAWKQTRSHVPQRKMTLEDVMRIIPGTLVSTGPSFEFAWERNKIKEDAMSSFRAILELEQHSAWRCITFDLSGWHREYFNNNRRIAACDEESLAEHLNDWLGDPESGVEPIERIHSLHLRGHTLYEEDWGGVPIASDQNTVGWLSSHDLERTITFFPNIATLSLMIEALDTQSVDMEEGEEKSAECVQLITTRLPHLTSLHIYEDPNYDEHRSINNQIHGKLSLQALRHIYACTTLVSLSLEVKVQQSPNQLVDTWPNAWPEFINTPLVRHGHLRHLTMWKDSTCCNKMVWFWGEDDDSTTDSITPYIGVASLPSNIVIQSTHMRYDDSHTSCMHRLRLSSSS